MRAREIGFITFVAASLLGLSSTANAQSSSSGQPVTAKACADSFERAQTEEAAQNYIAAKADFIACSQQSCPQVIVKECIQLLDTVRRETPSVGFHATDGAGKELLEVEVTLDDKVLTNRIEASLYELNPGVHKLQMKAAGFETYTANIPIYGGERGRIISVDLVRTPGPASAHNAASATQVPKANAEMTAHGPGAAPWVLVGVGGAALAMGAGFGLAAIHQHGVACDSTTNICNRDEYDKGQSQADVSTALFIGGGALVAGGLLWYFLGHPKQPSTESTGGVALSVGYRSVGLRGYFE